MIANGMPPYKQEKRVANVPERRGCENMTGPVKRPSYSCILNCGRSGPGKEYEQRATIDKGNAHPTISCVWAQSRCAIEHTLLEESEPCSSRSEKARLPHNAAQAGCDRGMTQPQNRASTPQDAALARSSHRRRWRRWRTTAAISPNARNRPKTKGISSPFCQRR